VQDRKDPGKINTGRMRMEAVLAAYPINGRSEELWRSVRLGFAFGFAQAGDAVAVFPLTAFLKQLNAFEALEHIAFAAQGGCGAETPVL
jgi:hypothetical protein